MTNERRKFDSSFKLEVVRMIKEQGLNVQQVKQSMDIGESAIRRWVNNMMRNKEGKRG